jgi:hypothetical protein
LCLPVVELRISPTGPCVRAISEEKQKVTFVHRLRMLFTVEEKMNVGVLQDKNELRLKKQITKKT